MSFKKYPKIERLGHEDNNEILFFGDDFICVEEKVDGGNGSFWAEEIGIDGIHFGSRNRDLTAEEDDKTFAKQQIDLREHLRKGEVINNDYIYYVEWMAKHTINYTNAPEFIGLDIRLKHSANTEGAGLFLGREAKEAEFKRLKIECIPLVWKGNASELKKLDINKVIPKSKFYDGWAEGIVIKNYNRMSHQGNHQLYAKLVREEFKECNKAVFGGVKNKNSDTNKIIGEYATDARIRKIALKLVNEQSMKLEMQLMKYLPTAVIKDILDEEFSGIFDKYKFIDFKEMKQKITKLCLRLLKDMMVENVK